MCVYHKKIIYLSCVENGIKIKRAGFVKMEFRKEACSLDMHVSGMGEVKEGKYNIEVADSKGQKDLIGSILLYRGKGDCRIDFTDGILKESKRSCREIDRISIGLPDGRWIEGSTGLKADKKMQNGGNSQEKRKTERWSATVEAAEISKEVTKGRLFQENLVTEDTTKERLLQENFITKDDTEGRLPQETYFTKDHTQGRLPRETYFTKDHTQGRLFQESHPTKDDTEGRLPRETYFTKDHTQGRLLQESHPTKDDTEGRLPQETYLTKDCTERRPPQETYLTKDCTEGKPSQETYLTKDCTEKRSPQETYSTKDFTEEVLPQKSIKKEVAKAVRENLPAKEIRMDEVILDDKWAQLCRLYQVVHPYEDEREYISIQPRDFVIMTSDYQHLANNSFLLHGFYNYRHLILGKEDCEEAQEANEEQKDNKTQTCFYLGVPGVYYEREKMVARMFGFEAFECNGGRAETGKFGYYLRKVKI